MKVIRSISALRQVSPGCVLTIGNFDGLHIGHQQVVATAAKAAAKHNVELVALTFEPHPVAVLHPEKTPGVLTPLPLKEHLLAQLGVDCLCVLSSSVELLSLSAEDFVEKFLVRNISPLMVVEGEDFNFGYQRKGNVQRLLQMGSEKGFEVLIIDHRNVDLADSPAMRVSSTMIRNLLESGSVRDAGLALGRPYRLIGQVRPGHGKGRQLGFPTANLSVEKQIVPGDGVYAGFVRIGDDLGELLSAKEQIPAALSIGTARTLKRNDSNRERPLLIEAHLLVDNVGELYDKWLAMDFVERLRGQMKFESENHLASQIAIDCQKAKQQLAP